MLRKSKTAHLTRMFWIYPLTEKFAPETQRNMWKKKNMINLLVEEYKRRISPWWNQLFRRATFIMSVINSRDTEVTVFGTSLYCTRVTTNMKTQFQKSILISVTDRFSAFAKNDRFWITSSIRVSTGKNTEITSKWVVVHVPKLD